MNKQGKQMRNRQQQLIPISKASVPVDIMQTLWFSEWWDSYPLKVSKILAQRVFAKHIRNEADYQTLQRNMPLWAKIFLARPPNKRPYPATFLNSGAWREPPPEDLLQASMGLEELLDCGLNPATFGWRLVTCAGGRRWER